MKNIVKVLLLILATGMIACTHEKAEEKVEKQPVISDSLMKMISIDTVKLLPVDGQLKLSGEIGFNDNKVVKVFPNSSGQVVQVTVSFGDYVKKGQTLAVIKSADVAGNYSDLNSSEADLKIAKRQMETEKSLYEGGISSQRDYETALQNYEKAKTATNKINNLIRINGGGHTAAGGIYTIIAPAEGFIVEKRIAAGAFIRGDMTDNLFTISNLHDVWVWANVYESDINKVKQGYKALVTTLAYPDKQFLGTVDKVNDLMDPVNKSLRVRITIANNDLLLKPQMFAQVIIYNPQSKAALAVPANAIVTDNGKPYVVVYNNNNDVKVKPVEILKTVDATTYITSGLEVNERVISNNQLLIYNALAGK